MASHWKRKKRVPNVSQEFIDQTAITITNFIADQALKGKQTQIIRLLH